MLRGRLGMYLVYHAMCERCTNPYVCAALTAIAIAIASGCTYVHGIHMSHVLQAMMGLVDDM